MDGDERDEAGAPPSGAAANAPPGPLRLTGPVDWPAEGALPLRGDLAHIALADRYLVFRYAVPQPRRARSGGARLLCAPSPDADEIARLEPGQGFETLDVAGGWCWGGLGPEGPAGYVIETELEE